MDEFNGLIQLVQNALPMAESCIPAITGGFVTAMFLRGNTRRQEFEKIKIGKINEAIDDLVDSRELTLTELVKCRNLIKIAKLADEEYSKGNRKKQPDNAPYDFDWFLRFFESAGNISNEDMQKLWAKILCGEYEHRGRFSLRTLDLLKNMSKDEARLLEYCSKMRIASPYNEIFLLNSEETFSQNEFDEELTDYVVDNDSDWIQILSLSYKISHDKISVLEQSGILSSILVTSTFFVGKDVVRLFNDVAVIEMKLNEKCKYDSIQFEMKGFRFTSTAMQLFSILDEKPMLKYILDVARLIEHYNPDLVVKVYEITNIDEDDVFYYNDEIDILHDVEYENYTELPDLSKLDEDFKNNNTCSWE